MLLLLVHLFSGQPVAAASARPEKLFQERLHALSGYCGLVKNILVQKKVMYLKRIKKD